MHPKAISLETLPIASFWAVKTVKRNSIAVPDK